jgi:hypothetical protein
MGTKKKRPRTPNDLRAMAAQLEATVSKLGGLAARMDLAGVRSIEVLHAVGADEAAHVTLPAFTVEIERQARAAGA